MKNLRAKITDATFRASAETEDKSLAFFFADPICTAYPFVNLNHFVFKPEALRKNVKSMNMKPLNFMHGDRDIIGHVNTSDFSTDNLGRVTATASGVLYRRIFPDLVEKMVNGQAYNMFKVSIEAAPNDLSWMLFNSYADIKETMTEHAIGEDPALDDDAMFCMWLFGTLNGLKYNDKHVAAVIGGKSDDFDFVGLAVTDELNGGAADQNTRILVLASSENKVDAGIFIAAKASESGVAKFEIAKAILRDERELLAHCGICDEVKSALLEEFAKFKSVWIEHSQPSEPEHEAKEEQEVEEPVDGKDSKVAHDVVSAESVAETIAALVLMKVEEADKTARKYMRAIESLKQAVSDAEVRAASMQEYANGLVEIGVKANKEFEEMRSERMDLRKHELVSLDVWDLAKDSEKDIVYMSLEEYSGLKKRLLSVQKPSKVESTSNPDEVFEKQIRRVVKKS